MNEEIALGLARHALTGLGSIAVSRGYVSADQMQTATGAIIVLIGVGWSVWDKVKKAKAAGNKA